MKRKIARLLFPVFVCSLLFTILPPTNAAGAGIKLLTLNLLFSEPTTSPSSDGEQRINSIADFILDQDIDCVICQEVVGGKLAKQLGLTETLNSSLDLKSRLGEDYKLRYRLANGIPLVFSVGNAIFCKAPIEIMWTVAKTLPFASEITINDIDIKLRRKIMGCLLNNVPGFGKLLLFNVHLCAFCPSAQRQAQIDETLKFIATVKTWVRWFYGDVPCVFGGDFNIHDPFPQDPLDPEADEYTLITAAGFADAYAEFNACEFGTNCCIPEDEPNILEEGCTFAVENNPFENDPNETTRIDYFFIEPQQAFDIDGSSAYVVFNDDIGPFVSDHSGLVVELERALNP